MFKKISDLAHYPSKIVALGGVGGDSWMLLLPVGPLEKVFVLIMPVFIQ